MFNDEVSQIKKNQNLFVKTIIEPFKIKSVEPIKFTTVEQRAQILKKAFYNPFFIHAEDVLIDLLTDSGTSAMSAQQWAGIMEGDESYAGARSFFRFEKVVRDLTGLKHIIPTHQGRAAEKILFSIVGKKEIFIPNNSHFDTTRANIEFSGATATDLLCDEGKNPDLIAPFKGNMNVATLEKFIKEHGRENIPMCFLTLTNNSGGGQPVSMKNIRDVKNVCKKYNIPLFLDACRFAENAYFIKLREKGYAKKSVKKIAQEMFSYADGATMSAKKDALVNMGGFLALNNDELAMNARNLLVITEGFPTYGGLAGRDLEAIAQGLEEVLDEHYLEYRLRSTAYLGEKISSVGVPILQPPGGHAIYLNAKKYAPHIPSHQFPGQAIVGDLYVRGGIRSVEIGSVMFGKYDEKGKHIAPTLELVRLAIPRRVYTQSHIDYVIEVIIESYKSRKKLRGMKIVWEPPMLRHFTAKFEII
ncbi:MAG: tryptophanase [Ignavibacteriales bacterium]|nr:tryptophanase [Ignavibacteriales bacterium]